MPLVESVRTPSLPTALRPLARSALIDCSDNLIFVSDVVVAPSTNIHPDKDHADAPNDDRKREGDEED